MPDFQEYCQEISELWESHWLTNMGKKHRELEARLKDFLHVSNLTLFVNGHLALENILNALQLPSGSEVITTPFTFASTTHAIVRNNLKPVFCDVRSDDYTLDASKIEALITPRTSAIVPVHVFGNICQVEEIGAIASKHHLKVIYDAAHAFGVTYKNQSVAAFGDASMFSFHATKVFNTIEGGAVCYQDEALTQRLNDLKNFGLRSEESCPCVGGNAKMNEFAAAMGLCNLRYVHEEIRKRGEVDAHYRARLEGVPGIKLNVRQKDCVTNYSYFPVLFDGYKYDVPTILSRLASRDIFARRYFYPLTSHFECYRGEGDSSESTPIACAISEHILTLPMYADLSEEDVDLVCDMILN